MLFMFDVQPNTLLFLPTYLCMYTLSMAAIKSTEIINFRVIDRKKTHIHSITYTTYTTYLPLLKASE